MEYKSKIKNQKGAITLYVLISMMFFLVIILGIYFNSSNKMQKQEKEVEKIQKEYEKNNINDIYENKYNEYINTETPTIQIYDGDVLKNQVMGEKVNSKKTIYLSNENVTLKFLSKNTSDKYAYSTTADGEKIKIEGNTLENINITTTGKTMYVYIVDNQGNYSKSYTAITMILVTLKDKTIYVEEGKETKIGEIQGENAGKISFGQIEDNTIIKLEDDTITGLKAGTTTLKAIEERAGATATITVKIVKLELASTSGTMLLGDSKTVKLTGINIGTLSIKINDEEISTVSINNSEMILTAKKRGNTTITITENNVNAQATYELKVASVALTPDGGTYTMPTTGTAKIKTTVTTVNAEKIEIAWSDNAGQWVNKENNAYLERTDCTAGTYYLYVKINGEAIYKSKEFIVGENTLGTNKIIIKPSTTAWTNGNVTATVTYGSTLILNKKAGYGTTLANAQSVASISTSTNLTATANGYFYAEATDLAGNKITTSLQISNIDKIKPTISLTANTTATANSVTLTGKSQDTLSGITAYAWTDTATAPTTWTSITKTTAEIAPTTTLTANGTKYFWTKDGSGNTNVASLAVTNIVAKASITSYTGITVVAGNSGTTALAYTGSPKSKSFISSNTAIATINASTGVVTGVSAGTATMTVTLTNYDGTTVSKTCTVTVQKAVAKVGTTYYSSITNAIAAITSGTVTLLVNQTETVTIPLGKTIVLALNGKVITGNITISGNTASRGTLTVTGTGTITNTVASNATMITNYGTATFNTGVKLEAKGGWCVGTSEKGTNGEITTINGATLIGDSGSIWGGGTTEIKSGNLVSNESTAIIFNAGTLNVTGGSIYGKLHAISSYGGTTNISGGSLSSFESTTIYFSGTNPICNISGSAKIQAVNTVNANNAVSAKADSGSTINIKGGTIESGLGNAVLVNKGIKVTITGGTITAKTQSAEAVDVQTGGTANITGGTMQNTVKGRAITTGGTLTINGTGVKVIGGTKGKNATYPTILVETGGSFKFTKGTITNSDNATTGYVLYVKNTKKGYLASALKAATYK